MQWFAANRLTFFIIDEFHKLVLDGQTFRPLFLRLPRLTLVAPGIGVHPYSATATRDCVLRMRH